MKGLDKGGQGLTSGCCAIEEEKEILNFKSIKRKWFVCMYCFACCKNTL
jgi:Fe-S-cluster containining protein